MVGAQVDLTLIGLTLFSLFLAVKCTVNARKVTISGKRGEVSKDLSHVACELKKMKQATKKRSGLFIRIRIWFGGQKQSCAVNTLKSAINNMIIGVTEVSFAYLFVRVLFPVSPTQIFCVGLVFLLSILIINYTSIRFANMLFFSC